MELSLIHQLDNIIRQIVRDEFILLMNEYAQLAVLMNLKVNLIFYCGT